MKKIKLKGKRKRKDKKLDPHLGMSMGAALTSQNITDLLKSKRTRPLIIYQDKHIIESEVFDSKTERVGDKYVVETWKETRTTTHFRVREYDPKSSSEDALGTFINTVDEIRTDISDTTT